MIALDLRTFGEQTWFLEIHTDRPIYAAAFSVEWQGVWGEGTVRFGKGVLLPGEPLLLDVPGGVTGARVRCVWGRGRRPNREEASLLDFVEFVRLQREAGVLAGEPVELEYKPVEHDTGPVFDPALARIERHLEVLARPKPPWWRRLLGKES